MSTELHGTRRQAPPDEPAPDREPSRRRRRGGLVVLAVIAGLLALVLVAAAALLQALPRLTNPFAVDTVDRSGPAVLHALEDLSEYRAATGRFQIILDVEEDARFLPLAVRGERTLFVAVGSVDAAVDFTGLGEQAVRVSQDRTAVAIRLPPAQLSDAQVDPEASYVFERRRGLLDRLGSVFSDSPTGERELYLLAQERLLEAAEETDLRAVAERNTRDMLESLLGSLGFTEITVAFDASP